MKNQISKYFLYFMAYAVFGWCYEVFLEVVIYRWGFTNRGVLFGPYCPVYGVGALAFLFLVYPKLQSLPYKNRIKWIPAVFLSCMTIATAIELATSYICEFFLGSWPWQTYANYAINFQARIALSPSLRFGLGGVIFLYLLQPLFERITGRMKEPWKVAIGVFAVVLVDMIYTFLIK